MEVTGEKILIADDEPDILEIIYYNLKLAGYEVFTAKDGDDALQKVKQLKPDLIILDVMMPKKNGMEVCEILSAISYQLSAISYQTGFAVLSA